MIVLSIAGAMLRTKLRGPKRVLPFLSTAKREDVVTLAGFAAAGTLLPVIDRTYPLRDAAAAIRHVEEGRARGKVVITV